MAPDPAQRLRFIATNVPWCCEMPQQIRFRPLRDHLKHSTLLTSPRLTYANIPHSPILADYGHSFPDWLENSGAAAIAHPGASELARLNVLLPTVSTPPMPRPRHRSTGSIFWLTSSASSIP